jgi:hypothetical protein
MEASAQPAAASAGITLDLVGAFTSLLDALPPAASARKVGQWRCSFFVTKTAFLGVVQAKQ